MRSECAAILLRTVTLAGVLGVVGCGTQEPTPSFGPTDPAGRLFDPNHIVEVAIEIAPADWDALRLQTRTWLDIVAAENRACLNEPFAKPFTFFPATVTVDGVRIAQVGIRKKGFLGSLDEDRPALKVRFDYFVAGQKHLGLSRLTLNNSKQDASYLRQCLSYDVFQAAGVPVPWCNFTHVTVNGRDLGLYVNVESMDRHWVRRQFESDGGDLWEGEYSDFRYDWLATFEKKGDVEDDDQTAVDRSTLKEVAAAAASNAGGSALLKELEPLIDVDEFMTFWATEKILEHWDGYANNANNFLIYHDPKTDRFVFIPSGTDQITVVDPYSSVKPPVSVYAAGILSNRLYSSPDTRALYVSKLRDVFDRVWDEAHLLAEIERMRTLVQPVLVRAGADVPAVEKAIEDLRAFVRGRRAVILDDVKDGPRPWDGPLRVSPCVDRSGDILGAFATTYGTLGGDAFRSGTATLTVHYRGALQSFRRIGATSGDDRDDPQQHWPRVELSAEGTNGYWYTCWIVVNPALFRPGAVVKIGTSDAWGGIGYWNPTAQQWQFMGSLGNGELRFTQAQATNGAPVAGTFAAWLISWN